MRVNGADGGNGVASVMMYLQGSVSSVASCSKFLDSISDMLKLL